MTSVIDISIFVSYSQAVVFDSALERPFNQWRDEHVAQGFAWRPGSAAFRTIEEAGIHLVNIVVGLLDDDQLSSATRIIDVPFAVPKSGIIEIGSISDCKLLQLPIGLYTLRYEYYYNGSDDHIPRIRFIFSRNSDPEFRVVRADNELSRDVELLLTAEEA